MANSGPDNVTPTATPKPAILVVILVVVLSILVLCLTGIAFVIFYRRRLRGQNYTRLKPSPESSDIAVAENYSHPDSNYAWNAFLRRALFFRPSPPPPNTYTPVQLPVSRPSTVRPPQVQFVGNSKIPSSQVITESSLAASRGPTPRRNTTPKVTYHSSTPIGHRNRTVTAPAVSQSIVRIAPLQEDPIPKVPPVRAPSTPIIIPTRQATPSRPPIEVINIDRPPNFTIDDTPTPSVTRINVNGLHHQRRPPDDTLHKHSYSDGYVMTRSQEPVQSTTSLARRPLSMQSSTKTSESDSVLLDQRFTRNSPNEPTSDPTDLQSPISVSSGSTTASNAGSSRPPTFQNLLKSISPTKARLPSLQFSGHLSIPFPPSSGQRTPRQIPPSVQPRQHAIHSESPPSHRTNFDESTRQDRQHLYPPKHPPEQSHRHLPQGDSTNGAKVINDQRLFPDVVINAGYQTGRVPNPLTPLPLGAAEPRRHIPPIAAPPPTPSSWAFLRTTGI